jgi:lycopene cyclase domain-containing protein
MTRYTVYNLALALFALPLSCWLLGPWDRLRALLRCARVALLMTLIGYPWDFFAIKLGVWRYPNYPGYTLHGVPLNDLLFMWVCTHLACSVLMAAQRRQSGRKGHSKGENAGHQDA